MLPVNQRKEGCPTVLLLQIGRGEGGSYDSVPIGCDRQSLVSVVAFSPPREAGSIVEGFEVGIDAFMVV
jgi:hypothetical protein